LASKERSGEFYDGFPGCGLARSAPSRQTARRMSVGRGQHQGRSSNLHTSGDRTACSALCTVCRLRLGFSVGWFEQRKEVCFRTWSAVVINTGGVRSTRWRCEPNPATLRVHAVLNQGKSVKGAPGQFNSGAKAVRQGADGIWRGRVCPRSGNCRFWVKRRSCV
jgi:hypothetical protein